MNATTKGFVIGVAVGVALHYGYVNAQMRRTV